MFTHRVQFKQPEGLEADIEGKECRIVTQEVNYNNQHLWKRVIAQRTAGSYEFITFLSTCY